MNIIDEIKNTQSINQINYYIDNGQIYEALCLFYDCGSDNFKQMSSDSIVRLFKSTTSKRKFVDKIGLDNIKRLSDDDLDKLLSHFDSGEIDTILGLLGDIILKLKKDTIYRLMRDADDVTKRAKLLGNSNIRRLTPNNIEMLLFFSYERFGLIQALGDEINKLSDDVKKKFNIKHLTTKTI